MAPRKTAPKWQKRSATCACGFTADVWIYETPRRIKCNGKGCKREIVVRSRQEYLDLEKRQTDQIDADPPSAAQETTAFGDPQALPTVSQPATTFAPAKGTPPAGPERAEESLSWLVKWLHGRTDNWVRRHSLVAVKWLRPHSKSTALSQQRNRDCFVLGTFCLSAIAVVSCAMIGASNIWLVRMLAAVGLYRSVDLFINIFHTGVFHNFRGDVPLNEAPQWQLRRLLVGVLFNYLELVLWYSVIYYSVGINSPSEFNTPVSGIAEALHLSISTMTTVGYGSVAPVRLSSTLLAVLQVITSVLLLATVVSVLVSLLGSSETRQPRRHTVEDPGQWGSWLPVVSGAFGLAVAYGALWAIDEMSPEPPRTEYAELMESINEAPAALEDFVARHTTEVGKLNETIERLATANTGLEAERSDLALKIDALTRRLQSESEQRKQLESENERLRQLEPDLAGCTDSGPH